MSNKQENSRRSKRRKREHLSNNQQEEESRQNAVSMASHRAALSNEQQEQQRRQHAVSMASHRQRQRQTRIAVDNTRAILSGELQIPSFSINERIVRQFCNWKSHDTSSHFCWKSALHEREISRCNGYSPNTRQARSFYHHDDESKPPRRYGSTVATTTIS